MRTRLNVYFPPALASQVDELAIRRRISRSAIIEAAVTRLKRLIGFGA